MVPQTPSGCLHFRGLWFRINEKKNMGLWSPKWVHLGNEEGPCRAQEELVLSFSLFETANPHNPKLSNSLSCSQIFPSDIKQVISYLLVRIVSSFHTTSCIESSQTYISCGIIWANYNLKIRDSGSTLLCGIDLESDFVPIRSH